MRQNYIQDLYAGVLGKVIGVYMGRPFEGWKKQRIEERWGQIDHYVHEDVGQPLVVQDDDITGTLTFIRALEDSGLYADTPVDFFGDTWLNYIIENKTILWWGGMGISTEHTAYLRLKNGIKAPHSGSIATNGKTVAEQIGAQIFIDGFGLVCPGRSELAAELAERAGRVSHDGEAVYAAQVVAAMISAAFDEKDMDRLLDIGVSFIPSDSMIAAVHRDVRAWRIADNDWHKTFDRIDEKYGYWKFDGNCHIIPNHAIMVLAWCYAPNNFHLSQLIINTAGWDTDCNAANVGCLMGVKLGLDRINEDYDFQSPFADRIYLPTAEGSRGVSDVLREAMHLARIGCQIMDWEIPVAPKAGAIFHFSQPGACHGFMPESECFEIRNRALCRNIASPVKPHERCLEIAVSNLTVGNCARVSTPVLPVSSKSGNYDLTGAALLSPGMTAVIKGSLSEDSDVVTLGAFLRLNSVEQKSELIYSEIIALKPGQQFILELQVPDKTQPVQDLGFEIAGLKQVSGKVRIDEIHFTGQPKMHIKAEQFPANYNFPGWVIDLDNFRVMQSAAQGTLLYISKNSGIGTMVTGTSHWRDYTFTATLKVCMADRGGILVYHQGQQRYIALVRNGDRIQLIKEYYGTHIAVEKAVNWELDAMKTIALQCHGSTVTAIFDGELIGKIDAPELTCGGAGFITENGRIAVQAAEIQ